MARREVDREDLLREATALVRRAELRVAGFEEPVVVGFRAGGAGSVYFGADPVVQLNSAGEFRRGFRNGKLLKADRGRLAELTRERSAEVTALVRRELPQAEAEQVLAELRGALARLHAALAAGQYELVGQVPSQASGGETLVPEIMGWLQALPAVLAVAVSPRVQ